MNNISKNLIAPCGMNCGICKAHLRENNPCHGCRNAEKNYPQTRVNCKIRIYTKRKGDFCFECDEFPCARLKHLDERYRTHYNMSEIDNLKYIKDKGIEKFVDKESKKYISEKGVFCVHDRRYYGKD